MLKDKTLTYISLFSCAGVGCFGFKKAGFECIATNELIERRLNVQKYNNKCRFESGYICDDITTDETKNKIFKEIDRWKELGNDTVGIPNETKVESLTLKQSVIQKQKYITDMKYPYWIIYRDKFFDNISQRLEFDKFTVFRDRQITNSNTTQEKKADCLRVIKSRNISDDGKEIVDIPGYDSYIKKETVEALSAYKYVGNQNVYLTPNMTYKPRVMRNTKNVVVNGSVAVLIPKEDIHLTEKQMEYFSSDEYRKFYQIARNYQTRSLNVDATSVFFYGVLKDCFRC